MGTLYVIGTPIGNLEDISVRALRIFQDVALVVCEDTRQTMKLLNHYDIKQPLVSFHQHSKIQKVEQVSTALRGGKDVAVVTDAGTPGVSDPGGVLVAEVVAQLGDSVQVVPIPGSSALTAIISVAGIPTDRFCFLGFIPHKKGRQTMYRRIAGADETIIFYESPHRIIKTLTSLSELLDDERQLVVGRELTKKFESIYRGSAREVLDQLQQDTVKGEFVVVVEGSR